MPWKSVLLGTALSAAAFLAAGRVFSGDEPSGPEVDASKPGPEHQRLRAYEGTWNMTGTTKSGGMSLTGRCTARLILGGRFLETDGEFSIGGTTYRTMEIVGYDNRRDQYVQVSVGDSSTTVTEREGQYDAGKKRIVFQGAEPGASGMERRWRSTWTDVAGDTFRREAYLDYGPGTGEKRVTEETFTRAR